MSENNEKGYLKNARFTHAAEYYNEMVKVENDRIKKLEEENKRKSGLVQ
jgi:hypothetical protein